MKFIQLTDKETGAPLLVDAEKVLGFTGNEEGSQIETPKQSLFVSESLEKVAELFGLKLGEPPPVPPELPPEPEPLPSL